MNSRRAANKQQLFRKLGEPNSLDKLAQFIISVSHLHSNPIAGLAWDISYTDSVSNQHYCPVDGVTCWSSQEAQDGRPQSYPGWIGRIWIRYYPNSIGHPGSEPVRYSFTYPGTGGFGSYGGPWTEASTAYHYLRRIKKINLDEVEFDEPKIYSYGYRFFLQDFPKLGKVVTWHNLNETECKHSFEWTDPNLLSEDKKLKDYYQEIQLTEETNSVILVT